MNELMLSILSGALALVSGLMVTILGYLRQKERARRLFEIDEIAKAYNEDEGVSRVRAMNSILLRLPQESKTEDLRPVILEMRAQLAEIVSSGPKSNAVEGLVENYHSQALGQAQAQFWFSVVAAAVGFAWILYAGSSIDPSSATSAVKILPGVVMDAAAFLFFRQAAETRQRATDLYDRLRRDRQMAESVVLVSSIEDPKVRSAVKAQIALHMSGLQPSAIDLKSFLTSASENSSEES